MDFISIKCYLVLFLAINLAFGEGDDGVDAVRPNVAKKTGQHSRRMTSPGACGVRRGQDRTRIVGGTMASPGEFPWMVSIKMLTTRPSRHVCGGAVLSPGWVITAAHCIEGVPLHLISVVAGEFDLIFEDGYEQTRSISKVVTRNDLEVTHFTNDIALLQLNPPLTIDGYRVSPICLPHSSMQFLSGSGVVAGWGRLSENGSAPSVLQQVTVPIIPIADCHRKFNAIGFSAYVHPEQLCLGYEEGGRDACQGDSGGPLVCRYRTGRYFLCGLVSWGIGCARPHLPGIYTEVARYSDWITGVMVDTYEPDGISNTRWA